MTILPGWRHSVVRNVLEVSTRAATQRKTDVPALSILVFTCVWRRRRDSNPRYGNSPYGGLANRWFQPLTHVSGNGSGAAAYIGPIHRLQPERTIRAWATANVRPSFAPMRFDCWHGP